MTTLKEISRALLPEIVDTPYQTAMRLRPRSATLDACGFEFAPGALQARDLQLAQAALEHGYFIAYTFGQSRDRWTDSEMRVFQIQVPRKEGAARVVGTIVTDGCQRLVRFCTHDARFHDRTLMRLSVEQLCEAASVRNYRPL